MTINPLPEPVQSPAQPSAQPAAQPAAQSLGQGLPQTQRVILAAACLALFMTNFDGTAGDIALPQIQQDLSADVNGVQWILNAYHLPVASLLLAMGMLGDLYGRRRIFIGGLAIFAGASVLCALAPSLNLLIAARSLQGLGAAALLPLSLTLVTATFTHPATRAKAIGIWSATSALAMVAGPGLGGLMVDRLGWQSIFWVNLPLGTLTLLLAASALPAVSKPTKPTVSKPTVSAPAPLQAANEPGKSSQTPWLSLALSILTLALLTYSLTQGETGGEWWSSHRLASLGLTAASAMLFWWQERRSAVRILPGELVKNHAFVLFCLVQTLVFFMSGGLFFILSLFLQQVQGYSPAATGLCFLPMNSAIITASFASGWITARLNGRFPMLSGLAMMTAALLALTGLNTQIGYGEILWTLVLAGVGGGLVIPSLSLAVMNAVRPAHEGIASALSSLSIQLGGIVGIALQGAIFSQRLDAHLGQLLNQWPLSEPLRDEIFQDVLGNLTAPPPGVPAQPLQAAIQEAFVMGLQRVLWVAAIAIVVSIGLVLLAPHTSQSQEISSGDKEALLPPQKQALANKEAHVQKSITE